MSGGHGFEYTPMGIVPLGTNVGQIEGIAPATGVTQAHEHAESAPLASRQMPLIVRGKPLVPAAALRPIDVIKLARARLRDVEREIKRLQKLEVERDELKRLLDAAARPLAVVRQMKPTRSA